MTTYLNPLDTPVTILPLGYGELYTPEVHVHQGGTRQAYCGRRLSQQTTFVAWEDASTATCPGCSIHFPKQSFDDRYNEDRVAGGAMA